MEKVKWLNKITVLVVLYVCILVVFGPPYTNKKIVSDSSYAKVSQESELSVDLYTARRFTLYISVLILVLFALVFYKDYLVRHVNSDIKIKRAIRLTKLSLGVVVAASISYSTLAILSFLAMKTAQSEALREFSRADFVWETAIAFFAMSCVFDEIRCQGYFAKQNTCSILANHYLQKYRKSLDENNIQDAEAAIVQACEADPFGVAPWAVRAVFTDVFLPSSTDADIYFKKATDNLKRHSNLSDEDKACYEFCLGNILLGKGNAGEAEFHVKKSLELHHDSERADFLKKLQKQYSFKATTSEEQA